MSDSNNQISKRKGSPEAAESTPVHKKLKPDSTEQPREGHAQDCTDADCEGCDDGELELKFDQEPTAFELLQMARDEAAKEGRSKWISDSSASTTDGNNGNDISTTRRMAKKLFDLAIETFEKLEQARNALPKDQRDSPAMIEERIQHAACEVAVGIYMPSLAMVEEGLAKYEQLIKIDAASSLSSAWVGLAIARISTARLQRKSILDLMEQDLLEVDEGTDEYEEVLQKASTIPTKEHSLVTEAIEAFKTGLDLLKGQDPVAFAKESIRAAQELEEYGVSVDLSFNTSFAETIFTTALGHLDHAKQVDPALVDDNADVLTLRGSCLFHVARIANQTGDESGASNNFEQAKQLLSKAEEMQGDNEDAKTLELLGQIYLMSTMDIEDEDEVMETYDKATAKLKRALELNPENASLRRQLEAIEGGEEQVEDEDQDFESDDEDGERER
ncbi:hypothetical protein BGW42_006210 [Actinomortierella wolfii]|nr:hypothetical protein BGW42_006210 [Actinomortierella wolfii]